LFSWAMVHSTTVLTEKSSFGLVFRGCITKEGYGHAQSLLISLCRLKEK